MTKGDKPMNLNDKRQTQRGERGASVVGGFGREGLVDVAAIGLVEI